MPETKRLIVRTVVIARKSHTRTPRSKLPVTKRCWSGSTLSPATGPELRTTARGRGQGRTRQQARSSSERGV